MLDCVTATVNGVTKVETTDFTVDRTMESSYIYYVTTTRN